MTTTTTAHAGADRCGTSELVGAGPLRRLHDRFGIADQGAQVDGEPEPDPEPVLVA